MLGGLEDPGKLVRGQGAALVASVGVGVLAGQVSQGVFTGSAVSPQPPAETLDHPDVMMDRSEGQPFVPDCLQGGLYTRGAQLGDPAGSGQSDQSGYPVPSQIGMIGGRSFGDQVGVKIV